MVEMTGQDDLALDPALLVGASDAGFAVERIDAVVGAEQHPPIVFIPTATKEDLRHRGGEVVERNVPRRDATDDVERVDVTLEERFLRLVRVDPMHPLPGLGEPEDEHVNRPDFRS